jgi:hypothetical protein
MLTACMAGCCAAACRDAWEEIIERCEAVGVDAFEINFSCPHGLPERKMGMAMGQDCDLLGEVCGWINAKATVPVWGKMTPNITDITQPALVAVQQGARQRRLAAARVGGSSHTTAARLLLAGAGCLANLHDDAQQGNVLQLPCCTGLVLVKRSTTTSKRHGSCALCVIVSVAVLSKSMHRPPHTVGCLSTSW